MIAPQAHVWERGRGEGHGSVYLASQGAPARSCGLGAGSGCTMSHEVFFIFVPKGPRSRGAERTVQGTERSEV